MFARSDEPELGDLDWAAAVVPAPGGDIVVVADASRVMVQVPQGTVLVRDGHAVPGPSTVQWGRRFDRGRARPTG